MKQNRDFDLVIVGAGLAGLSAAYLLQKYNVLLLEKEAQPGGRILTKKQAGIFYELGAIFAYPTQVLPFFVQPLELIGPPGPIGIYWKNELYFGQTVGQCLKGIDFSSQEMLKIKEFYKDQQRDANKLSTNAYEILNAFFQVIHPGEIKDYLPQRQLDAFINHDTRYNSAGNYELIEQYINQLNTVLECNAQVFSIKEQGKGVVVNYRQNGLEKTVSTRAALLTQPAPAILNILETENDAWQEYLQSIDYQEGSVIVLGLKDVKLADFSYIVTPELAMNTVLQQKSREPGISLLFVYYAGKKSIALHSRTRAEMVEKTLQQLKVLGIAENLEDHLLFTDFQYWPYVGPVISSSSLEKWQKVSQNPSERIFLSGEQICWDFDNPFPYGMASAIVSGKVSGKKIQDFLRYEKFQNNFLVRTYRYLLTDYKPVFKGSFEEGNIAFYGLVLQAEYNQDLKDYLLDCQQDHLWEWQTGYGVTAEDSALVLEGLWTSNVEMDILLPSLKRLKEAFFSHEQGVFHTVTRGRAKYWSGPSIDATAQIAYLMQCIAPGRFKPEIKSCLNFILEQQKENGYWQGKWLPSRLITTFYAVRLCAGFSEQCLDSLQKARQFILNSQQENGSWNNSVIDTACAILTMNALDLRPDQKTKAARWLGHCRDNRGWAGEPVLYYWFEQDDPVFDTSKLFYQCIDKGSISRAWALLALKTMPVDKQNG